MAITVRTHFVLFLMTTMCFAQSANAVKSPEVHSDGRVTFRLKAPKASAVKLWGDWITRFNTTEAMEKNAEACGPSPLNHFLRASILTSLWSMGPLPEDERDVPHGTVHMHWYQSFVGLGQRRFLVYTPPDYAATRGTRYRS